MFPGRGSEPRGNDHNMVSHPSGSVATDMKASERAIITGYYYSVPNVTLCLGHLDDTYILCTACLWTFTPFKYENVEVWSASNIQLRHSQSVDSHLEMCHCPKEHTHTHISHPFFSKAIVEFVR